MNFKEYQTAVTRTFAAERTYEQNAINYAMGLCGEAGEVTDHIKKTVYHGHNLNEDEVEKELGDVLWYVAALAEIHHLDLNEIAEKNIHKLMKRFPNGFSEEDSKKRVDMK
ncbi:TPA: nucleoside triphosphate pyrophosphohydrolase family protein [Bacillus cereus]|nr:nucleoside triphosphate pyrophosphohydrolase family protein [Bacillus cereus]MED2490542.1 nucleoside triphosphate pyrophosphohydrolase family protein [Bacillus thuringiensis]HDR8476328.1 nucleoside triphosphate pyrophosphohydrolase family protein [Bacillus cereus]